MKIKLLLVSLFLVLTAATAFAAKKPAEAMLFDDYNRDEITKGKFDNSDGIAIYWISSTKNNPAVSMDSGAVKLEFEPQGWFAEGAAVKDPEYNFLVLRVKGEVGGEESKITLKFDSTDTFIYLSDLIGPNGAKYEITTEFTDLVIDIAASGFPADVIEKGWEALHFNTYGEAATIWIDEIYLCGTPPKGGAGSAYAGDGEEFVPPPEEPEEPAVSIDDLEGIEQDFILFDDFNIDMLTRDPRQTADGGMIYWANWTLKEGSPEVSDGAVRLDFPKLGWFAEGASVKEAAHRFVTFRIKGAAGGEGELFTIKLDNSDIFVRFADLADGDGNKVPAITTEWQNITFDLSKSGFEWERGFEALHLNTYDTEITIWIDEIYLSTQPPAKSGAGASFGGDGVIAEVGVLGENLTIPAAKPLTAAFSYPVGAKGETAAADKDDSALDLPLLIAGGAAFGVGIICLCAYFIIGKKGDK